MERLKQDIEQFLRTGQGDFDVLAIELFRYQFEKNAPYRAFCEAVGRSPDFVERWEDIPAVPVRAFKSKALTTFPAAQAAAVFHSSATTTAVPSRHYIKDLRYYQVSLKTGFLRGVLSDLRSCEKNSFVAPAGRRPGASLDGKRLGPGLQLAGPTNFSHLLRPQKFPIFILTPSPAEAPHSSLAWMMEVVRREWGAPCSDFYVLKGRLDEPRLARDLARAQRAGLAVILLGTTLAFKAFFDYCEKSGLRFQLLPGSRLMDTGGMKASRHEVTRSDFIDLVQVHLGLPDPACINEYGMCELSSQFYGRGRSTHLQGPPWVRTRIIDLATGEPAAPGQPGLLCHYDLANVDSVMAVLTEDMGIRLSSVDFDLLGRAPEAELKGCSLNAETFFR